MTRLTLEVLEANLPQLERGEDCWIVHNISRGLGALGPDPSQSGQATVMIYTPWLDLRGWARFYQDGCHAVTAISRVIPAQSLEPRIKNRSRLA